MSLYSPELMSVLEQFLNIGIALSAEKDFNRLLEMILTEARRITNADAGTLYFAEGEQLVFKIVHNETLGVFQGGKGEVVSLPPVPMRETHVCAWSAIHRRIANIADVYDSDQFDFSGPRRYDQLTGYRTKSMLVIPLENYDSEIIGVLQLINARNAQDVVPFAPHLVKIISSLASQAAVSITNMRYVDEINNLFDSFVQAMATAVDARTPYNANHSHSIAVLAERLARYLHCLETGPFADECFDQNRIDQLVMAAWLHDIGKVAIPLEIMDKHARLGKGLDLVLQRLDYIAAASAGRDAQLEADALQARELIIKADSPSTFVDPPLAAALRELAARTYSTPRGEQLPWLTPEELGCLIIARGTLTAEERKVMESHVIVTERILSKIAFNKRFRQVPMWAVTHHEFLDGSGYPRHLQGTDVALEARILTVLDIYDALTAADRPYKRGMSPERALSILQSMAGEGKLDRNLVDAFCQSRVWEQEG